jgi:serine/threonine protein kinase
MLSKGTDSIISADHCGEHCYSALECLKDLQYSKQSDMYSLGATIFEYDVHKPFGYARDGLEHGVSFFIDVHENGRQMETWDKSSKKWIHLVDEDGVIKRESLTPDRSGMSIFAPILESICSGDPSKRPSASEVMESDHMESVLKRINELGIKGKFLSAHFII